VGLKYNIVAMLGVAGVSQHETETVRRWAAWLEIPVIIATLWLPFLWYAEVKGLISRESLRNFDLFLWGVFLFEFVVVSALVRHKILYWRQNWLSAIIVSSGLAILFVESAPALAILRSLRLIFLLVVAVRIMRWSLRMMARRALAATLIIGVFLVGSIGTLVATIEPKYNSIWDGLWWAIVTISTVGYGDFTPETAEGRILATVLIVFGVLTFSMVMANVTAFMVGLRVEEASEEDARDEVKLDLLILQRLDHMDARFDRMDALLRDMAKQHSSGDGRSNEPNPP
jgi:voltage-gated potassium channel